MIVTVASFKGGVGKTTTAVHVAAYLQMHKSTLLMTASRTPVTSSHGLGALYFIV